MDPIEAIDNIFDKKYAELSSKATTSTKVIDKMPHDASKIIYAINLDIKTRRDKKNNRNK